MTDAKSLKGFKQYLETTIDVVVGRRQMPANFELSLNNVLNYYKIDYILIIEIQHMALTKQQTAEANIIGLDHYPVIEGKIKLYNLQDYKNELIDEKLRTIIPLKEKKFEYYKEMGPSISAVFEELINKQTEKIINLLQKQPTLPWNNGK